MGFCDGILKTDKSLLPVKAFYFLFFSASSCVLPFRQIFAKQLGLSATSVGIIFMAVPFLQIVTNPLFGFVLDYFKKFRLTLSIMMGCFAVILVTMLYIPPLDTSKEFKSLDLKVRLKCHSLEETFCNNNNGSCLELHSQLVSTAFNDRVDISCEITCRSQSSLESIQDSCVDDTIFQAQLVLKERSCTFEQSFSDQNFVIIQNSSRYSVNVSKEALNLGGYFKNVHGKNCSFDNDVDAQYKNKSKENQIISYERSLVQLRSQLNDTSLVNPTLSLSSEQFPSINAHVLFFTVDDYSQMCTCMEWRSCSVNNCKQSRAPSLETELSKEIRSTSFWLLFILVSASSMIFVAVGCIVDAMCYEIMDNKEKYGLQRLWGTIGWGFGAFIGGYLNEIIDTDKSSIDYTLSFYFPILLLATGLFPVSRMKVENVKYSSNICEEVCELFSNVHFMINIFMIFAIGIVSGLIWNYQFWFMTEIGSSQMLLGLSQIAECWFAELPCFLISGWVIRKIGHVNCNSLTILCYALRYLSFSYMQNPWMTLPLSLIVGPTYGIFFVSMTMYGKTVAPPGTEVTVQAVLALVFEGLGCGIGSILGGIGFDTIGSRSTFFYTAIACFILLKVNIVLRIFVLRPKKMKLLEDVII